METPAIISADLKDIARYQTDQELFEALLKQTERLVKFFSYAVDDETWSLKHLKFHELALQWLTQRYFEGRLAAEFAQSVLIAIHEHFPILDSVIPRPMQLLIEDKVLDLNPLVCGVSSRYLRDLIRTECYGKNTKILRLKVTQPDLVPHLIKYMEIGNIDDLWKWPEKEIRVLAEMADKWGLQKLSDECEQILCRYVSKENVIESLLTAQKQSKWIIRDKCIQLFNASTENAEIFPADVGGVGFKFRNFLEKTLALFDQLKGIITYLSFDEKLTNEYMIKKITQETPHLFGLDISSNELWAEFFQFIPSSVQELNVASALWLNDKKMRELAVHVPQIKTLNLAQNTQLSYLGLGELRQFRDLQQLNLADCHQIGDSELSIVLQAIPQLLDLSVSGCKKLSDLAFHDLARQAKHLQFLNASRTAITDGTLIEIGHRCQNINHINLDHCLLISDWGVRGFLKHAKKLHKLSIKEDAFSEDLVTFIQVNYPQLEILI